MAIKKIQSPDEEKIIWASAYSVAAAVITLGQTIYQGAGLLSPSEVDMKAVQIADKAVERLKGKIL